MGKGEATKHRSPGSSFSLYPLWASILEIFIVLDLTFRNLSAAFEVGGRTHFTVFPLFQFIQRLGQALQRCFCAWVFCCFMQAHWNLGRQHRHHWGVFFFWWNHSQTCRKMGDWGRLFPRTCCWLLVNLHLLRQSLDLVLLKSQMLPAHLLIACRIPSLFLQLKCAV